MSSSKKQRQSRKSFATETLKNITNRVNYYKRMLNNKTDEEINENKRLRRIKMKYDHALKVRFILNRALSHRYEYVKKKLTPLTSPFNNIIF